MKQGRASRSGMESTKVEPKSRAVDPAGVNQLGNHVGPARAVEPLYEGRGYKAPMTGEQSHHCGSQGKHK